MAEVPEVDLTFSELRIAAEVAIQRQSQHIRNDPARMTSKHGAKRDNAWTLHIEGASGEMAVAKYLGKYWSGAVGDFEAADVGPYQVRTRAVHEGGDLLLHPEDADEDIYILVCGFTPNFRVMGWIRGKDGKLREYWRDPKGNRPCYWVPYTALHSMETLPKV